MASDKSNSCWHQILTGKKTIQTQTLALQMLLKRLQRNITPSIPEADIDAAAGELHAFSSNSTWRPRELVVISTDPGKRALNELLIFITRPYSSHLPWLPIEAN